MANIETKDQSSQESTKTTGAELLTELTRYFHTKAAKFS